MKISDCLPKSDIFSSVQYLTNLAMWENFGLRTTITA
jgi:hypothetical protein